MVEGINIQSSNGAPTRQRCFYFWKFWPERVYYAVCLTMVFWFWEATCYPFLDNSSVFSSIGKLWNKGHGCLPCMLLLCVCWWKWCDADPTMLLLLLELVELLSGLGVAIVVLGFRQQRSGCNAESETSPSLPLDGTLRHLNAGAAPGPRLCCCCCLPVLSEIQGVQNY